MKKLFLTCLLVGLILTFSGCTENEAKKEIWGEEEDCYYFEFYQTINDCGIIPSVTTFQSERVYMPQVSRVILNKDGLVELTSDHFWNVKQSKKAVYMVS